MWIISRQNVHGLIYAYAHALTAATKLFCQIRHSEVLPKYFTALLSDVGVQEDWPLHTERILLVTVEMAMLYQHTTGAPM